jgi:hypothetical protein
VTLDAGAQTGAARIALPSPWFPGFAEAVAGEELEYHSPLPDAQRSLVVRSEDAARGIEWTTAPVPPDFADDVATFVMLAGIDATDDRREFVLSIDGRPVLRFETPLEAETGTLRWTGEDGVQAEFRVTLVDRYADAMGYPGEPLRVSVVGESAGSRTWFMVFKSEITPGIEVRGNPAVVRTPNGLKQTVRVDALYFGQRSVLRMEAPGIVSEALLGFGFTRLELEVAAVETPVSVPLSFSLDGQPYETELRIEPVPALDLYLIHHTHLDIGYTHVQDEVERMQWAHLEEALRLGVAAETMPKEARFVWHPEGAWAIESYLATRPASRREALLEGIRRGWIHVDGLYANVLTGLATGEVLFRTVQPARDIRMEAGVPLRSAMFSDIPGMSWGVVPTLAQAGIRYLSVGPNRWHRIGDFLDTWSDRPFWWESASGQERVLTWVHGGGYSMFHTGLGYEHLEKRLDQEIILAYADTLAARGWPRRGAIQHRLGQRAAGLHPVRHGGSLERAPRHSAPRGGQRHRAVRRAGGPGRRRTAGGAGRPDRVLGGRSRLVGPRDGHDAAIGRVARADRDARGHDVSQWERKKQFAEDAVRQADRLRSRALGGDAGSAGALEILNTTQWERSEVVVLSAKEPAGVTGLRDPDGVEVPSQRLADGSLAFRTGAIPAWSGRRYEVLSDPGGEPDPAGGLEVEPGTLDNGVVRVTLDPERGGIASLTLHASGRELVPPGEIMDEYLYVPGRDPAAVQAAGPARVQMADSGPLVWTAVVSGQAPGTESGLQTTVRLFADSEAIEITHRLDKTLTYEPEAVLLRFPVALEEAGAVVGGAWGAWRAETDQPPGANRNYATVERWADLHDDTGGLQVVSVDVPGIQLGSIGTDPIAAGWRHVTDPEPVLYSYVMNNYWETNYRAAQDGPHELRYTLRPHAGFDEAAAERFASTIAHPLVVHSTDGTSLVPKLPLALAAGRSIVTLVRALGEGDGLLVRMYNPSDEADEVRFTGDDGSPVASFIQTDPWGEPLAAEDATASASARTAGEIVLAAREVATLVVRP